jgi:hypothetical protein
MSKNVIFILMYHRHKPLDPIQILSCFGMWNSRLEVCPHLSVKTLYKLLAPYCHVKFSLLFADQDGAEPSGNSVAASNLVRLNSFLDRPELRDRAARLFTAFRTKLTRVPIAVPEMTSALMCYHDSPIQVSSCLYSNVTRL